jgi:large subunit ribosomal protein L4
MATASAYSKTGTKRESTVRLEKSVFGLEGGHDLVGLAYRAYLSNGRSAHASTLKRGEVRGGGKKPWRQKGTGRARVGSIRVPNWKGGGVVFGPTGHENHTVTLPLRAKRLAIRHALSLQAANAGVVVLETFDAPEGKVKPTIQLFAKIGLEGNLLLAVSDKDGLVDRATRNIPGLKAVQAKYLNVFDIMNADKIVITEQALAQVNDWLGEKS